MKQIFTEFQAHIPFLGHKKQRGPIETVTSGISGDSDHMLKPRSLTGSNSISPRCGSVLPRTITTISHCKKIRQ